MHECVSVTPGSYPAPLDAIVLAGTDDNPRRMIQGRNKAFLDIGGAPLVRRMVDALQEASGVGHIFVVGPRERLADALRDTAARAGGHVSLVEQSGKMLANASAAIGVAEQRYRQAHGRDDPQRPVLFISSDLPLVSAAAIQDFVVRCAREDAARAENFSMLAGVAEEASLRQYYPDGRHPGIRRPYVHLADCKLRLANIYVVRPRTLAHQAFLQTGFEHRKAEKWKNVVALAWHFLGQAGGWSAAWLTLRLQATLMASRGRKGALYRRLRRGNTRRRIERGCSTVLGGSVRIVITPYGELSLDADNEEDFQVLSERFDAWRELGPVDTPGLTVSPAPEPSAQATADTAGRRTDL